MTLGKEEYNFLVSQLDLYDKICTVSYFHKILFFFENICIWSVILMWMPFKRFTKWTSTFTLCTFLSQGRNSYAIKLVTQDLKYLTWQDAFKCLSDDSLPDSLRAHYAHLIISMLLSLSSKSSPILMGEERGSERIPSFIYQNWTLIIVNKSTRQKW